MAPKDAPFPVPRPSSLNDPAQERGFFDVAPADQQWPTTLDPGQALRSFVGRNIEQNKPAQPTQEDMDLRARIQADFDAGEEISAQEFAFLTGKVQTTSRIGNLPANVMSNVALAPSSVPKTVAMTAAGLERGKYNLAEQQQRELAEAERGLADLREKLAETERRLVETGDVGLYGEQKRHLTQAIADAETGLQARRDVYAAGPQRVAAPETTALWKLGEDIQNAAETPLGAPDPALKGDFFTDATGAVGQMAGYAGTAALGSFAAGPAAGIGAGAAIGMSQIGEEAYSDARAHGSDIDTALRAALLASPAGATEILPIANILSRATGGASNAVLKNVLVGAGEEALQEYTQQVWQNIVAAGLYDPERGEFVNAPYGGAVGGAAGAIIATMTEGAKGFLTPGRSRGGSVSAGQEAAETQAQEVEAAAEAAYRARKGRQRQGVAPGSAPIPQPRPAPAGAATQQPVQTAGDGALDLDALAQVVPGAPAPIPTPRPDSVSPTPESETQPTPRLTDEPQATATTPGPTEETLPLAGVEIDFETGVAMDPTQVVFRDRETGAIRPYGAEPAAPADPESEGIDDAEDIGDGLSLAQINPELAERREAALLAATEGRADYQDPIKAVERLKQQPKSAIRRVAREFLGRAIKRGEDPLAAAQAALQDETAARRLNGLIDDDLATNPREQKRAPTKATAATADDIEGIIRDVYADDTAFEEVLESVLKLPAPTVRQVALKLWGQRVTSKAQARRAIEAYRASQLRLRRLGRRTNESNLRTGTVKSRAALERFRALNAAPPAGSDLSAIVSAVQAGDLSGVTNSLSAADAKAIAEEVSGTRYRTKREALAALRSRGTRPQADTDQSATPETAAEGTQLSPEGAAVADKLNLELRERIPRIRREQGVDVAEAARIAVQELADEQAATAPTQNSRNEEIVKALTPATFTLKGQSADAARAAVRSIRQSYDEAFKAAGITAAEIDAAQKEAEHRALAEAGVPTDAAEEQRATDVLRRATELRAEQGLSRADALQAAGREIEKTSGDGWTIETTGNVPRWITSFTREVMKNARTEGLAGRAIPKLRIVTERDGHKPRDVAMAADGQTIYAAATPQSDGSMEIWLSEAWSNLRSRREQLELVAHELGHAITEHILKAEIAAWDAKERGKARPRRHPLVVEHDKKLGPRGAIRTQGQYAERVLPKAMGRRFALAWSRATGAGLAANVNPAYEASLDEWLANEISRALTTGQSADSVISRFFDRLAAVWRAVSKALRAGGYTNRRVVQFLQDAGIDGPRTRKLKPGKTEFTPRRTEAGQAAFEERGFETDQAPPRDDAVWPAVERDRVEDRPGYAERTAKEIAELNEPATEPAAEGGLASSDPPALIPRLTMRVATEMHPGGKRFVARNARVLDLDEHEKINKSALKHRGHWSAVATGFMFEAQADRDAFVSEVTGNPVSFSPAAESQNTAEAFIQELTTAGPSELPGILKRMEDARLSADAWKKIADNYVGRWGSVRTKKKAIKAVSGKIYVNNQIGRKNYFIERLIGAGTPDFSFELSTKKHLLTGKELFIARASRELSEHERLTLNRLALSRRGEWSQFFGAFVFEAKDRRDKFVYYSTGERRSTPSEDGSFFAMAPGPNPHRPDPQVYSTLKGAAVRLINSSATGSAPKPAPKKVKSLPDDLLPPTPIAGIDIPFARWRTFLQDYFTPQRALEKEIERQTGQELPENMRAYLQEELMSGRIGARMDRLEFDFFRPIVEAMNDGGLNADDVGLYLTARHDAERRRQTGKTIATGLDGQEVADIRAWAKGLSRKERAALARVVRLHDQLVRDTLRKRVQAGLVSQETADAWRGAYRRYTNLSGFDELDGNARDTLTPEQREKLEQANAGLSTGGRKLSVKGPESRRAFGRASRSFNPLVNVMVAAQEAAIRAEKNKIVRALYELVRAGHTPGMVEIVRPRAVQVYNPITGIVESFSQPAPESADMVTVKIDGREIRLQIKNPVLLRSYKNVGVHGLHPVLRLSGAITQWVSLTNTTLNPEFTITNALRDMQTAGVNLQKEKIEGVTRAAFRDWRVALRGAWNGLEGEMNPKGSAFWKFIESDSALSAAEWARAFREYSEAGGKIAFFNMEDRVATREALERDLGDFRGAPLSMAYRKTGLRTVIQFIERANLAVDNAIRLATYAHARKQGLSKAQAASMARNLTVNFNRRGLWGSQMNAIWVFYNAAMQGGQVMLSAMHSKRVRTILGGAVAAGASLGMLNAFLSPDDDDGESMYDKLQRTQPYLFERNLVIAVPWAKDADDFIKIPLPYGYNLFPEMGRQAVATARGIQTPVETAGRLVDLAASGFAPVDLGRGLAGFTPTAALPFVEMGMNENYQGRPITSQFKAEGVPDSEQYSDYAGSAYVGIAKGLNTITGGDRYTEGLLSISPDHFEHLGEFALGGVGRFGSRMLNLATKIAQGEAETIRSYEIPFGRQLHMEYDVYHDRALFYDRADEALAARQGFDKRAEDGAEFDRDQARLAMLASLDVLPESASPPQAVLSAFSTANGALELLGRNPSRGRSLSGYPGSVMSRAIKAIREERQKARETMSGEKKTRRLEGLDRLERKVLIAYHRAYLAIVKPRNLRSSFLGQIGFDDNASRPMDVIAR